MAGRPVRRARLTWEAYAQIADLRDAVVRRIEADLHTAGMRLTAARLAVLAVLRQHGERLSHRDLIERMVAGPWDHATVFRTLVDLTAHGLIERTQKGHLLVYCSRANIQDQAVPIHFVCVICQAASLLKGAYVAMDSLALEHRAIFDASVEVLVRGRCRRCR